MRRPGVEAFTGGNALRRESGTVKTTIFQEIIDLFNANEYNFHSDLIWAGSGNAQLKIIKSDL